MAAVFGRANLPAAEGAKAMAGSLDAVDARPSVHAHRRERRGRERLAVLLMAFVAANHERTNSMFTIHREALDWGGRRLVLETGKVARQADGAVFASYGETTVLATVVAAK